MINIPKYSLFYNSLGWNNLEMEHSIGNFGFRPFRPVEVVLENGFEKWFFWLFSYYMFLGSWDWARNGSFGIFRIRGHLSSWEVVKGQIWKWTESRHVICFWKPLEVSMEDLFWVWVSEADRGYQRLSEITNIHDWKFPGSVPLLYHKCTTFVVHVVHIGFVPQYVVHISINQWKCSITPPSVTCICLK